MIKPTMASLAIDRHRKPFSTKGLVCILEQMIEHDHDEKSRYNDEW